MRSNTIREMCNGNGLDTLGKVGGGAMRLATVE